MNRGTGGSYSCAGKTIYFYAVKPIVAILGLHQAKGINKMAKKSINEQIQEHQNRLNELELQAKAIQDEKRTIKKVIQQLEDARIAELGRSLLAKLHLQAEDIDQAFAELDHLPALKQDGGQTYGDQ